MLWVPARVTVTENRVKIASKDGVKEFKPLALSWQEPNKFVVSGTDDQKRIQRVFLRFSTPEMAQRASDELKLEVSILDMKSLPPPPVEIQAQIRTLYSVGIIAGILLRSLFGVFAILVFFDLLASGVIHLLGSLIGILILGYFFLPALLLFATMRRTYPGFLIIQPGIVATKTGGTWDVLPVLVEVRWESPTRVTLKSRGSKRKIQFLDPGDAERAVHLIRDRFASPREVNAQSKVQS